MALSFGVGAAEALAADGVPWQPPMAAAVTAPPPPAGETSRALAPAGGRAADGAGAEAAARAYHTLSDAARQSGIASQGQADVWSQITWFGLQAFGFTPMVYAGERSN